MACHHVFDAEHFPAHHCGVASMLGVAVEALHGVVDDHVEERRQGFIGASFEGFEEMGLVGEGESVKLFPVAFRQDSSISGKRVL